MKRNKCSLRKRVVTVATKCSSVRLCPTYGRYPFVQWENGQNLFHFIICTSTLCTIYMRMPLNEEGNIRPNDKVWTTRAHCQHTRSSFHKIPHEYYAYLYVCGETCHIAPIKPENTFSAFKWQLYYIICLIRVLFVIIWILCLCLDLNAKRAHNIPCISNINTNRIERAFDLNMLFPECRRTASSSSAASDTHLN